MDPRLLASQTPYRRFNSIVCLFPKTHPFPLLRLPSKSLKTALRFMNGFQLILLSFCSTNAKNATKLVITRSEPVIAVVVRKEYLLIDVFHRGFQIEIFINNESFEVVLTEARFYNRSIKIKLKNEKFPVRDYLLHVLDVTSGSTINIKHYDTSELFQLEEARRCFKNILINRVYCLSNSTSKVLQYCSISTELLTIDTNHTPELAPVFHTILSGNFKKLKIKSPLRNLDHLLNMNSSLVNLQNHNFTEKELNLFLKHWILGVAHRNLKTLSAHNEINDETALWNGIRYQVQPESRIKITEDDYFIWKPCREYRGGYDIKRNDGVEATLYIFKDWHCFHFVVWH